MLSIKQWFWARRLLAGLLAGLLSIGLLIGGSETAAAAKLRRSPETKSNNPSETVTAPGKLTEVSPPVAIQELRRSLETYQPQLKILSPRPDEVLDADQVSVRFQLKDLPLFKSESLGLGPHLHVFLDDQPYQAVYSTTEPLVLKDLTPGTHTIRAFASRPWHEGFKNEGAYAQTTFHVFTKTGEHKPAPEQPLLTYSRPQGTYGAEPVMVDFYLTNAPLHLIAQERKDDDIKDWRIRCTVNGKSFTFDEWQPIYLKGLKSGKNWVQLELVDDKGTPIPNVFNSTARVITYQPGGSDTLSKLVHGDLSAAAVQGIVDSNYKPAAPAPTPSPTPVVTPPPVATPTPTPSPTPVATPTPAPVPNPSAKTPPSKPLASPPPKAAIPQPKADGIVPLPSPTAVPRVAPTPAVLPTPEKQKQSRELAKPTPTPTPKTLPSPTPIPVAPQPVATPKARALEPGAPTGKKEIPTSSGITSPALRSTPTPVVPPAPVKIPSPAPSPASTAVPSSAPPLKIAPSPEGRFSTSETAPPNTSDSKTTPSKALTAEPEPLPANAAPSPSFRNKLNDLRERLPKPDSFLDRFKRKASPTPTPSTAPKELLKEKVEEDGKIDAQKAGDGKRNADGTAVPKASNVGEPTPQTLTAPSPSKVEVLEPKRRVSSESEAGSEKLKEETSEVEKLPVLQTPPEAIAPKVPPRDAAPRQPDFSGAKDFFNRFRQNASEPTRSLRDRSIQPEINKVPVPDLTAPIENVEPPR